VSSQTIERKLQIVSARGTNTVVIRVVVYYISTYLTELLCLISFRCLIVIWITLRLADSTAHRCRIDEKAFRIAEAITRIDENRSRLREIR
jgi:hypothetical protein